MSTTCYWFVLRPRESRAAISGNCIAHHATEESCKKQSAAGDGVWMRVSHESFARERMWPGLHHLLTDGQGQIIRRWIQLGAKND
jgi:hypothetical protein